MMSYYETCRMRFWGYVAYGLLHDGEYKGYEAPGNNYPYGLFSLVFALERMRDRACDSATLFDNLARGRAYYLDGGE